MTTTTQQVQCPTIEYLSTQNGYTPAWRRGLQPVVTPKFKLGTITPYGKIVSIKRGSYHYQSEDETIVYHFDSGNKLVEYDLMQTCKPNGNKRQLGQLLRWFVNGKFRSVIVEALGYNTYAAYLDDNGDIAYPEGMYLVSADGKFASWETI